MDLELAGKVAIVTGASRGIGRSIALELGREGVQLTLVARSEAGLREIGRELPPGPAPLLLSRDLLVADARQAVVESTVQHFGALHILINNVGASVGGDIAGTNAEDLQHSFQVNVEVPFLLTKAALPHMEKSGFGRVVMLASIYGRESGGKLPYNAAKAAETSLAKGLAREVASKGITVNTVAPGSIRYPGGSWDRRVHADPGGMAKWIDAELPLRRFGTAEEVAAVVAFLCSPRASLVNGASIVVDGGQGRSNL